MVRGRQCRMTAYRRCDPLREPRFPRIGLVGVSGVGRGLGVFAAGHKADERGAAAELIMQALEPPRHAVFGGPPRFQKGPLSAQPRPWRSLSNDDHKPRFGT